MSYDEVFDRIADLLLMQLPITKEQIKPESRLIEDLGADSANIMIFICDVENEFDIEVDNDNLAGFATVNDIVRYLTEKA